MCKFLKVHRSLVYYRLKKRKEDKNNSKAETKL